MKSVNCVQIQTLRSTMEEHVRIKNLSRFALFSLLLLFRVSSKGEMCVSFPQWRGMVTLFNCNNVVPHSYLLGKVASRMTVFM